MLHRKTSLQLTRTACECRARSPTPATHRTNSGPVSEEMFAGSTRAQGKIGSTRSSSTTARRFGGFLALPQTPKRSRLAARKDCERPMKADISKGSFGSDARLAQRKSTSFTRKGSQVQILQRAPFPATRRNRGTSVFLGTFSTSF